MKTLKFRYWDPFNGVMVYSENAKNLRSFFAEYEQAVRGGNEPIIMQFTGLFDKNGREIYEGDIVHYRYLPGETFWNYDQDGIILWDSTGFKMEPLPERGGVNAWLVSLPGLGVTGEPNKLLKVIGNIYENPELLGVKE